MADPNNMYLGPMGQQRQLADQLRQQRAEEEAKRQSAMQNAFNLPGFERRQAGLLNRANFAAGRQAPQVGQSDFRNYQQQQLGLLSDMAQGRGPSAAENMLNQALQTNVSTQQALLASGRGNPAQARAAQQQANMAAGGLAGQVANARVQEQLGAIGQLGQAAGAARGLDQALGFGNAGLDLRSRAINDQAMQELLRQELQNASLQQGGQMSLQQLLEQRRQFDASQPGLFDQVLGGALSLGTAFLGNPSLGALSRQTQSPGYQFNGAVLPGVTPGAPNPNVFGTRDAVNYSPVDGYGGYDPRYGNIA